MDLAPVCPPMPLSARCDGFTPTPPARTLLAMNSGADAGDAITGAGRETVKSRLRYAMDKLRARLNE